MFQVLSSKESTRNPNAALAEGGAEPSACAARRLICGLPKVRGFGFWNLGFRDQGFRVSGLGFSNQGFKLYRRFVDQDCRFQGSGFGD